VFNNVVAVDNNNSLWVWGRNRVEIWEYYDVFTESYGLINGDADIETINSPRKIMDNVKYACAADDRLYILTLDNVLIEWKTPKNQVILMDDVKHMESSAYGSTLAVITNDGRLLCRGLKNTGQDYESFIEIAKNVEFVAVDIDTVCYVDNQGKVYFAGYNMYGLSGNGEKMPDLPPPIPDAGYEIDDSYYVYPPVQVRFR